MLGGFETGEAQEGPASRCVRSRAIETEISSEPSPLSLSLCCPLGGGFLSVFLLPGERAPKLHYAVHKSQNVPLRAIRSQGCPLKPGVSTFRGTTSCENGMFIWIFHGWLGTTEKKPTQSPLKHSPEKTGTASSFCNSLGPSSSSRQVLIDPVGWMRERGIKRQHAFDQNHLARTKRNK